MKRFLLLAGVALLALPAFAGIKDSDVDSTGPDFTKKTVIVHVQGQLGTSDVTAKAKWTAIEAWKITAVKAVCRARTGAAGDVKFDVLDDGVSVLTAQIATDVNGTIASGTLTATPVAVAAGSVMTIDYNATNTPTADDCDIQIVYRSKVAAE